MTILQTQSVALFFLDFYCPYELENGNTYNKEQLYIMTCIYKIAYRKINSKKKIKTLTRSAKYTENRCPEIILRN